MYDDKSHIDPAITWRQALAMVALAAVIIGGLGYIFLKLVGLL